MKPIRLIALFLLLTAFGTAYGQKTDKLRILVFTDLHHDLMPDAPERLRAITAAAEKSKADLMISLGDIVFPQPENRIIPEILAASAIPCYHALGNHDMDRTDKQTFLDFFELTAPYYYFDWEKFRFIVLDTNFYIDSAGKYHPYNRGDYFSKAVVRDIVDPEQLDWLRDVLADTSRIAVVLSHAPINDRFDRADLNAPTHRVLTEARERGTRIALVIGGHNHSDNYHRIDGINYLQANSASYIWGGEEFDNRERYPDSVYQKYPSLRYTIPYVEPLYTLVDLESKGAVRVHGLEGRYREPAPDTQELTEKKPYPCSPSVQKRVFTF